MAEYKNAVLASPENTGFRIVDGKRVLLVYGNGSVWMAKREGFKILYQLNPAQTKKEINGRWQPLTPSSK